MNAWAVAITLIACFGIMCLGPLAALAEVNHVTTIPTERCGPRCVIESYKCDTEAEAKAEAKKHGGRIYMLPGSDKYFVEVHLTEAEAKTWEGLDG